MEKKEDTPAKGEAEVRGAGEVCEYPVLFPKWAKRELVGCPSIEELWRATVGMESASRTGF